MAFTYKKYKVSLDPTSEKTQGLQTGDIVRRQYVAALTESIYSLMCVLDYGSESATVTDDEGNETTGDSSYFIGLLLDGDAPENDQLLDFVRITNLFDEDRSGALYLTASDDEAPYMDVIDGVGRNSSLSWPESIGTVDDGDSASQYIFIGTDDGDVSYTSSSDGQNRILSVERNKDTVDYFGIRQDFYEYLDTSEAIIVSYFIKGESSGGVVVSLGYTEDDSKLDGEETYTLSGDDWVYKVHVFETAYNGKHLRSVRIDLSGMESGDVVEISDLNIIPMATLTNFAAASSVRIGKLTGISDDVFGTLDGYGGYLQKLYASNAAHISGTLTAGDENGFASTFYAGRIHTNAFVNSLEPTISGGSVTEDVTNPTAVGNVYEVTTKASLVAQTASWLSERIGETYTFSFYVRADMACTITVSQNGTSVGTTSITESQTEGWYRRSVTFDLIEAEDERLKLALSFSFTGDEGDDVAYISAFQLESGEDVSQYQATDDTLSYVDDYGAWFSRGGIGGTIQNPLLQLNYDGEGGIGTQSKSLYLAQDGSGYIANKNISWDEDGDVTFSSDVTLSWSNLDEETQENMAAKSVVIVAESNTFYMVPDNDDTIWYEPSSITLTLEETNIDSTEDERTWYYLSGDEYVEIEGENGLSLEVAPEADYWGDATLRVFKCSVDVNGSIYSATYTISKVNAEGYIAEITSSDGTAFVNGTCSTTLTVNVRYNGTLLTSDEVDSLFDITWTRASIEDKDTTIDFDDGDATKEGQSITLDYEMDEGDWYMVELTVKEGASVFPLIFPVTF